MAIKDYIQGDDKMKGQLSRALRAEKYEVF